MRILDKSSIVLDIEKLGLPEGYLPGIAELIERPHGIILVTGPTGSGKTTTLYCALQEINSPEKRSSRSKTRWSISCTGSIRSRSNRPSA